MLKGASNGLISEKRGSTKREYLGPLASGLNRRAFLKTSVAISLLSSLIACNVPLSEQENDEKTKTNTAKNYFTKEQHKVLDTVQMQLFPDDGDGPSARDLNAISYLEWAMTDPQNSDDDDPAFIAKGIGWLNDISKQTHDETFVNLSYLQQDLVLKQVANSQAGENWLSILLYYLTESLMLDPVYGGNPNHIGWQWLQHQPGFPAPIAGKTYRDFI